ncbi:MAG: CoA transferase [Chloroflexi bacterium]|nr:CoA transferase [Chloroflexota bacterium]
MHRDPSTGEGEGEGEVGLPNRDDHQALAGLRVVEFAWMGVGPQTTLHLARCGAEIVHVETSTHVDPLRTMGPYRNQVVGWNLSGMFENNNPNKLGITLNLNTPQGPSLARRLCDLADVIVENMSPEIKDRWGLTYEEIKRTNPSVIMVGMASQGQWGPHSRHPGHGGTIPGLAGFYHFLGWPDLEPSDIAMPYTDWVVPHFGAAAILAALDYRSRTGKGAYIDISHIESSAHALGPVLLDYTVNGRVQTRQGNRDPAGCPHGVYRCRGEERWCAIAVFTDAQWDGLVHAMGNPPWAREPRFATALARHRHQDELDRLIGQRTAGLTPEQVMATLQAAGVPAGVVSNCQDMYEDPQLLHRGHYEFLEHPEMGRVAHGGASYRLSETPPGIQTPAPRLGEYNERVFQGLLGLGEAEYVELIIQGVLD